MKDLSKNEVERLTAFVLEKKKYSMMHPGLVRMIVEQEFSKGRRGKKAQKAILGKLHQVGAAYFEQTPDYPLWKKMIRTLPRDLHTQDTRETCIHIMQHHHSTHERLYILGEFFQDTLAPIQPIASILDLACGLNPLALPWMPIQRDVRYLGCDIFEDMIQFLQVFADHFHIQAAFQTCNIFNARFTENVDVAFLLKTLPCLEQVQKGFSSALLESIPANHILISYPISSLSGKSKGMANTYNEQFKNLIAGTGWTFTSFSFTSEIAFLVNKV